MGLHYVSCSMKYIRIKLLNFSSNFLASSLCSSSTNAYSHLIFSTLSWLSWIISPQDLAYIPDKCSTLISVTFHIISEHQAFLLTYLINTPWHLVPPTELKRLCHRLRIVWQFYQLITLDKNKWGQTFKIFLNSPFICPVKFLHLVSKIIWIFFLSWICLELLNVHFSLLFGRSKFSMSNTCHIPLFLLVNWKGKWTLIGWFQFGAVCAFKM